MIEKKLEDQTYLVGNSITEADIRFIPTLLRFDCVYYLHFKCNLKKISEYKNINRYMKTLFKIDAIKSTTDFNHIKRHYYYSHEHINPFRIIPIGPENLI
jgi:putative glutathione S-transferase